MKAFVVLLVLSSLALAQDPAPKEWEAWAQWAEKLHPITDAEGHGPDIGSDEWANALGKRLGITDTAGHGPDLKSNAWRAAVEKKLKQREERTMLSAHDTIAIFSGIQEHTCRGRTLLCPDRCGHSGKLATFQIVKYLDFTKHGEFGDPKQERFQVLIEDKQGNRMVTDEIHHAILALKTGDSVHLKWNHDYVSRDGSKFPERVITLIEKRGEE